MRTTRKFSWVWLLALLICLVQQGAVLHGLSHGLQAAAWGYPGEGKTLSLQTDSGPADSEDAPCLICVALNCFSALALTAFFLFPVRRWWIVLSLWRRRQPPQGSPPRTRARSPPFPSAAF